MTVHKATVLRIESDRFAEGKPPVIASQTVIANGFGSRADKDAFLIGPTGLALGADDTLYVSDALDNRIVAIPDASTRADSAGTGRTVTKDGLLQRPLALAMTPNGHLLAMQRQERPGGRDRPGRRQADLCPWIDADQAQSPPGNGDLFGIAMTPDGKGFYYVEDDVNTLMEATR